MNPTITKQYTYATGGITEESLKAWEQFCQLVRPADGWQPESISCNPSYPIEFEGRVTHEHVVMLTFRNDTIRNEDQVLSAENRVSFVTDGFLWGYGGEGPVGLARVLEALMFIYDLSEDLGDPDRKLIRFIAKQPMDQAWSENLAHLAKLPLPARSL
jgi:hypothetical protein